MMVDGVVAGIATGTIVDVDGVVVMSQLVCGVVVGFDVVMGVATGTIVLLLWS